jgi:hypothetical protein
VVAKQRGAAARSGGGYSGPVASSEAPTPEELQAADLVKALRATGNMHPLVAVLREGDGGPERARDALMLLGELDLELLVQVALDTLIEEHVEDPARARQTRRQMRGETPGDASS